MASSECADLQRFQIKGGSVLASLRSHPCARDTDERYILWTDIRHAFLGIDHLETVGEVRILFTIDINGELWQPLRIQHDPDNTLIVICSNNQRQQAREFVNVPQDGDDHAQSDSQNQALDEISPSLKDLFNTCKYLYQYLKTVAEDRRNIFRQAAANARYYHSTLLEEVKRLDKTAVNILAGELDRKQMLDELGDLERQVPEWTYRNNCRSMLFEASFEWDFSISLFFIVLPSDLDSWDNLDPSTHQFRLYFICDNWEPRDSVEEMPQHVHLSSHPGYNIERPDEFFHVFGDYVLRVLQMVKNGYSNSVYEIPPLDTFKILWNCDPDIIGHHLTKDTIIPLFDKAIAYIQELSPPKWVTDLALDRSQSAAIKTFLDILDGDNAEGNLLRYTNYDTQIVSWKCPSHTHRYLNIESLQELTEFVSAHGGHVDMQQGRLRVELGSIAEADQFLTLLKGTKHVFIIAIKLLWKTTRLYVKDLCVDIDTTGTAVLELDGITPDTHPQGCDKYIHNLFDFEIFRITTLKLITLINYPRPQEQCIHIRRFSIQSILSPIRPPSRWVELKSDLEMIYNLMSKAAAEADCNTAARELKSVLEKHGFPSATVTTIYDKSWNAVFDQESGAVIELHSKDMVCPKGVLAAESIRTLGVHFGDLSLDEEFFQMVQNKTLLEDLCVSHRGHDMSHYIEDIVRIWHTSECPFRLTLLDHMQDTRGRVIAQLAISGDDSDPTANTTADISGVDNNPPLFQRHIADKPLDIIFLKWDCDHVFSQLSDYTASFLEMAAQQHSSALTSFTLDVSRLSPVGLTSIQEVLRRSNLEYLNIVCTLFTSSQAKEVAQVLGSVQWCTLKFLVLSGGKIDEWCQLWPFTVSPRLLSIQIKGPSSTLQDLSHSSILFLQYLIFASPLVELHFKNVQLQDKRDWVLVIDSVDLSLLRNLDLGEYGSTQFLMVSDATDVFVSELEATLLEADIPKLVLPSFILDITTLSPTRLDHVRVILSFCIVEKLVIECCLFNLNMSDTVIRVLQSVQWPLVGSLTLSGDNINQWIQLLIRVDAPRLKTLQILGVNLVQQELSHASVLFVESLISASSFMTRLCFQDVLLQDQRDWVLLVEKMDPSMLDGFDLGDGSYEQFISNPEAVDLERLKRTEWSQKQRGDIEE